MKKFLKFFITAILVVAFCTAFAACADTNDNGNKNNDDNNTTTYTITFDANGGKFSDGNSTVTATTDTNGKVSLPSTDPTQDGYTFASYNTAKDGSGSSVTASYVYSANTTVYAIWTANTPSGDSSTTYKFEAEYTDLSNLSGDGGSNTVSGINMISNSNAENASNGYYVTTFNGVGQSIEYKITSDKAATVEMSLVIMAETTAVTYIDPEVFIIKVNGKEVSYTKTEITTEKETVSAIKWNYLFTTVTIGDIDLVSGENEITLTIGSKTSSSGTTIKGTYGVDVMTLKSSDAVLAWVDPIEESEWADWYI